jgi:hypothetical protein
VLLVIDQLEELFTLVRDESTRRHFLDGLTRALHRPDANLRIVATLRADFLDRPLRYSEFGRLVKRGAVTVVGMSAPELESAITRPAAGVGVEVEPALATQLVADVFDQPAALPLLQFTLTELFDLEGAPVLTLQGYRALGGVDAAVAGRAEAVYGRLAEAERELARRSFLRLVTVEESRSVSRRRALRSDLVSTAGDAGAMNTVIDAFGTSRLLTFDNEPENREPTVEIAHEALIEQWPRFGEWVASAGEGLRIQGQLAEAARTWEQQGRDAGDLYRGLRLESSLEWADSQPDALRPLEREFLTASADARAAEHEAQRTRAERDRRTNRRLSGLLTGVGLLLLVALVAGALAIRQQRRADDEAAAAREAGALAIGQQRRADDEAAAAREAAAEAERQTEVAAAAVEDADLATLISRSAAQSAENPELSVLLALEANRRAPGSETEQAVLNALGSSRIANRVVTFPGFDLGDCPKSNTYHSQDGLTAYMHAGGQLLILDLTTGQITEHAPAEDECGVWLGDFASKRTAARDHDLNRSWVGTFDDPYAIELEQTGRMWLLNTDLGSNVAAFGVNQGADDHEAVVLFDATTGEQIGEPIGEGTPWKVAVDPSGSFVAISEAVGDPEADVAEGVGRLHVLDATTGDELFPPIDTIAPAASITFDPATRELIAGMTDGGVMTVDLDLGEITSTVAMSATDIVGVVSVRPDGLIVTVTAAQIELVDRRSGPTGVVTKLRDTFEARVRDDGLVVIRDTDNQYAVVEIDGSALVERSWPVSSIARVAFDDGQAGVLNRANQEVSIVDLASGEQTDLELRDREGNRFVADSVYPERDGVWSVGRWAGIARWEGDTLVERIEIPDGLFKWRRFGDTIAAIRPDADDNQVASLISLEHDAAGIRFTVPAPLVNSAHPTLDGGLYVFNVDGSVDIYDANGEATGQIETGARFTADATMDPSTGRLAVGTSAGVVVIDPVTGEVEQLPGITSVANFGFARDGQLLVISGFDGTVRVWDLDRGEPAGLVWDGTGVASSFSPSFYDSSSDSIWVFTSGRLIEVPLDPQRWVERACDIVGRDLTQDEWVRYVPGANDAEDLGNAQALGDEPVPQSACT